MVETNGFLDVFSSLAPRWHVRLVSEGCISSLGYEMIPLYS
jgi:hypothetical protein